MLGLARQTKVTTGASGPVLVGLAGAAVFLLVGCLVSDIFAQQTVAGLAQGAIFGGLALALVLIYRATEVINFAQGEMAMATTYVCYQLVQWGVSYWLAFFLTLVFGFVFGVFTYGAFIRPVQHRSVIAIVIVTLGLFILIDGVVAWIWGADIKFMASPFGNKVFRSGGVAVSAQDIGVFAVSIISMVALWALFQFTKVGLAMRAAALRPGAASLVGVRVDRMLAIGWGLAAVLGAVAGMMAAPTVFLDPSMMLIILIYAFAAAVLGGIDSPIGAVVGGLLLGVIVNVLGAYVVPAELRLPTALAILLLVLIIRPQGLFGHLAVRRV